MIHGVMISLVHPTNISTFAFLRNTEQKSALGVLKKTTQSKFK